MTQLRSVAVDKMAGIFTKYIWQPCICRPNKHGKLRKKLGGQAKIWGGMTHPSPPLESPLLIPCFRFRFRYPLNNLSRISKHLSVSGYSTRWACFQRSASLHTTVRKVYSHSTRFIAPNASTRNGTKPDALEFKWKNYHSRAIPLSAKSTLFFCFSDWKCTTSDVIFMDWVTKWQFFFILEVATGLLVVNRLE